MHDMQPDYRPESDTHTCQHCGFVWEEAEVLRFNLERDGIDATMFFNGHGCPDCVDEDEYWEIEEDDDAYYYYPED